MKRVFATMLAMALMLFPSACNSAQEGEAATYTFKKVDDAGKLAGTSKLMNIIDGFPPDYTEQCVLILGRLLNLFGTPLYETVNLEDQYSYIIQATGENGKIFYLNVYRGSSGPAIGANGSVYGIKNAALALIEEIQATDPLDFSYEGYSPDAPSRITMGIKDGEVYYTEELITDSDEIARMWEEISIESSTHLS